MRPLLLLVLLQVACTAESPVEPPVEPRFDPTLPGPYTPAHTRIELPGDRPLTVEIWYPSEATVGSPVPLPAAFGISEEQQADYASQLSAAPADCPTRETSLVRDATPISDPLPAVVFSHCHACTRFSATTVASHLASHGILVAAPDHAGNTLWDEPDPLPINGDTLALREADLSRTVDALADLPLELTVDDDMIAAMGHSFGAGSVARLTQSDDRIRATMAIAAPFENPLVPGVDVPALGVPLLWLVAVEDNSITEFGNMAMRFEFDSVAGPAHKLEVADAGHWSFSDLCGLSDFFSPGCGEANRQTNGEAFTYLPVTRGLDIAKTAAAAFFGVHLLGHPEAAEALAMEGVEVSSK